MSEPGTRARRGATERVDRAFDVGIGGFALWTLCSHATVWAGGSLNDLMVAAAGVLAVAGGVAWWWRGAGSAPHGLTAARGDAEPPGAPRWPRAVVGAGAVDFISNAVSLALVP